MSKYGHKPKRTFLIGKVFSNKAFVKIIIALITRARKTHVIVNLLFYYFISQK